MATWTAESRKTHKRSGGDFAGPGTSYPIKDGEDVKNAWDLAGKAANPQAVRSKVKSIAKKLGLTASLPKVAQMTADFSLPSGWTYESLENLLQDELNEDFGGSSESDEYYSMGNHYSVCDFDDKLVFYSKNWQGQYQRSYKLVGNDVAWGDDEQAVIERTVREVTTPHDVKTPASFTRDSGTAVFALTELVADGDLFRRTGKVFEVGQYADKNFSLNTDEARNAVAAFQPLLNRGAHVPTIFDGKMGTLERVELADDGITLNGTISVPKWLQEVHGPGTPLAASLEWDRETKTIVGSTLIPNPRVADSALMAAFSESNEPKGTDRVSFGDTIRQMLGLDKAQPIVVTPQVVETPKEQVEMSATDTAREIALQKQVDALLQKDRRRDAEELARAQFADRRVLPAQLKPLVAVFEAAIIRDNANEATVNFADEKGEEQKVSMVEAIKAVFAAAPQHQLTLEVVPGGPQALFTLDQNTAVNKDDPDGAKAAAASAKAFAARLEKNA